MKEQQVGLDIVPAGGESAASLVGLLPAALALPMEPVESLDRIAEQVALALEAPVGLVSLVDVDGQFFPGVIGLPEPWLTERWTPLSHSFCQHVVTSGRPLVVSNAHDDPLVRSSLAIAELGVVAYVGSPLHDASGRVIGSLCVIDHKPRHWTDEQLAVLGDLATTCSTEIAARN